MGTLAVGRQPRETSVANDGVIEPEPVLWVVLVLQTDKPLQAPLLITVDGCQSLEPSRIVDIIRRLHTGLANIPQVAHIVGPLARNMSHFGICSRRDQGLEGSTQAPC